MKLMTAALVVAFASGSLAAFAAERSIMQKGKTFSESAVTLKKGDSLMFVNDDTIHHNILSTTPGSEFNLGSQAPGASAAITFNKSGEIDVLCAIHPRMKLAATVE
jgi:plastocyanin